MTPPPPPPGWTSWVGFAIGRKVTDDQRRWANAELAKLTATASKYNAALRKAEAEAMLNRRACEAMR